MSPGIRAPATLPEWLGASALLAAPVAVAWIPLTAALGRHVGCLVRARTGVPCPLCGGVTSARALVAGDVPGALAANPVTTALLVTSAVLCAFWLGRCAGVVPDARPLTIRTSRIGGALVLAGLVVSWLYQLQRFALL